MDVVDAWRQRAAHVTSSWRDAARKAYARHLSLARHIQPRSIGKNNSEFSNWLTDHLSNQGATLASKGMDAEYLLRISAVGGWHKLYGGGHNLAGNWKAVGSSLPDLSALDPLGIWANEYWKDLGPRLIKSTIP
jgi:hypothetical protein